VCGGGEHDPLSASGAEIDFGEEAVKDPLPAFERAGRHVLQVRYSGSCGGHWEGYRQIGRRKSEIAQGELVFCGRQPAANPWDGAMAVRMPEAG
jgi:hypothetical protein